MMIIMCMLICAPVCMSSHPVTRGANAVRAE